MTTKWHVKVETDSLDRLDADIRDSCMKYMYGVDDGRLSSPGEESGGKTLEGREELREKWYKAWAEVDKAYAKVDSAYAEHDKIKAYNGLYKARAEHAKARAEFSEWLRRNDPQHRQLYHPGKIISLYQKKRILEMKLHQEKRTLSPVLRMSLTLKKLC